MELIYDPSKHKEPMNAIAFGSGSCTTIEAILAHQKSKNPRYKVAALVTDNALSEAHNIAKRENIPLVHNNLELFMQERGLDPQNKKNRRNTEMRTSYDARTAAMLLEAANQNNFRIDIIALAGYMLKLYPPILDYFAGRIINSHPANLAITEKGKRKYTGDKAVYDAIIAGEKETHTSIHLVREEVDAGEILVTSKGLPVNRKEPDTKALAKEHQALQKKICDYPAYCFALEEIAKGNFALEDTGKALKTVIYKGERMPYGGVQL